MNFKAVIFDLDGTLLDTIEDLADATNGALSEYGYPTYPVDRYKKFVGDGMENLVKRTLPSDVEDPAIISAVLTRLKTRYDRIWNHKSKPYADIPQLLDALEAAGLKLAILSNKPDSFMRAMVVELLPKWSFKVVYGERPGHPRKPDPASALEIAGHLGCAPSEILYLGDTDTDMNTAVAAGMYPVGVLWGFRDAEELLQNGARSLIRGPLELLKLL